MTSSFESRAAFSTFPHGTIALRTRETSFPKASPKPPGSTKSRCMSIMTNAVVCELNESGNGCA
jgi:hypothetical protein